MPEAAAVETTTEAPGDMQPKGPVRGGDGKFATDGAGTVRKGKDAAAEQPSGAPAGEAPKPKETPPAPWKQRIRYKADGKDAEVELTEDRARTILAQQTHYARVAREAQAERQKLDDLKAKAAAGDPGPLLKHLGIDPHEAFVRTVQGEAQRAAMTPEEQSRQAFEAEKAELARQRDDFASQQYQEQVRQAAAAMQPVFEAEFPKALEAVGLPLESPTVVAMATDALREVLADGELELEPYLIHAAVTDAHEKAMELAKSVTAPMSHAQLAQHLGLDARFASVVGKDGKVDAEAWRGLKTAFPLLLKAIRAGDMHDFEEARRAPSAAQPKLEIVKPPPGQHWIDPDSL